MNAGNPITPSAVPAETGGAVEREPVHFLDGLRCPTCRALNASWLTSDASAVECSECGQTVRALGDDARGAA